MTHDRQLVCLPTYLHPIPSRDQVYRCGYAVRHFTHKGHVPEATATTGLGIDEDRSVNDIAEVLEGRSQRLVRRPAAQATDEHLRGEPGFKKFSASGIRHIHTSCEQVQMPQYAEILMRLTQR